MTINAQDIDQTTMKLGITSTEIDLTGTNATTGDEYHLHIDLFKPIVTTNVHKTITGSHVALILQKVSIGEEFWPRLTKEKIKYPYIRTDFDKWVDEDEQEFEDMDKEDGLQGIDDLEQFRNQNLDFSGLSEQLGLNSSLNDVDFSESNDEDEEEEDEDEDEEEDEVDEKEDDDAQSAKIHPVD